MATYDIAIIGGGPGGYVAAIRAAQLGKRVALIEKERVGGLCLNWGCIPSKSLLWNAEVVNLVRDGETYGIAFDNVRFDMGKAIDRSRGIVDQMVKGVEFLLQKNGVTVISGAATFVSPTSVAVAGGETVDATNVIIGGGPIGVEFAQFWRAYGVDVTILEALEHLLPLEDVEISAQLERAYKKQGIKFVTGAEVTSAATVKGRGVVTYKAKGAEQTLDADRVLIGIGFEASVEGLGLEKVGVQVERGWVKTDGQLATTAPGVYAIGDVTGIMNLAHVASAQGVTVVERLAGLDAPDINYQHVPRATYCQPEVASVGLTEQQARDAGYEVKVGKFPVRANGRAKALNATDGMIKIVADADAGETLGVHMVGPMVTELLAEASLAMTLEATPRELGWTIAAHPTLGESIKEAALAVSGEAIHFWTE